jgi:hypothetical protein
VAFHHLPTVDDLDSTFRNMRRILTANNALYITDFALLRFGRTMKFLVNLNKNQPDYFKQDYLNSLHAAFPLSELKRAKKQYFPEMALVTTFMIPFMFILKSHSAESSVKSAYLTSIYNKLSGHNKKIFRDIYYFFRLGGVSNALAKKLL